jgi:adenylate kinase
MLNAKPDQTAWLKGGDSRCNVSARVHAQHHRFVLLGAPGVGKGTQGELLTERLGLCSLSMGEVFRAAKRSLSECECSPTMQEALRAMARGELVPDETVIALLEERGRCLRCGGGFVLDGFPRTIAQAEELTKILVKNDVKLQAVLSYELPLDQLVARLSGRRTCPGCKKVFHINSRPPRQVGICDDCGQALFQRDDDAPAAIRVRMAAYEQSTAPLTGYYREKGLLLSVDASGTSEECFNRTLEVIQSKFSNPVC